MSSENQKTNKSESALREEAVLKLWQEKDIFSKALAKDSPEGEFVFFDGPPTANGMPGLHHLEPRCFKDAIPRYKTMRGYHVRRKGGWDTHGLPVELQVEKELGLKSKKEIEEYGVEKFNQKCRESVWKYIDEWEKFTDRVAYWVDHKNPYVTYHNSYIESVWNILAETEKKKLLYKDYKVLPWCPRCGTALSSHELAQGYQDDKDLSVTAKFKVIGQENTYFLAWTTTPWTLPGNVGLAVGEDIDYVKIKKENDTLILAKERLSIVEGEYELVEEIKGKDLVGLEYEPLYSYFKNLVPKSVDMKNAYKVHSADFVTTTDGTGLVHTAVMYGQVDFELGTKVGMPKFHLVKEDGHFIDGMDFLSGRFVKDEEVAIDIIKDLAHRGLLFKKEKYEHSYPHCWRCKTPLIYYARDSWYIEMSKLRNQLLKENESINWEPSHIKDGRFGEWLREVKDWAISRERYWGTPLPIWQSEDGERIVVDSIETLKKYTKKSGNKYFFIRHGQGVNNTETTFKVRSQHEAELTEKGKEEVKESMSKFKEKIDVIISSPFVRTKQTAQIVCGGLGFAFEKVVFDERAGEWEVSSEFEGKDRALMLQFYQKDYADFPKKDFVDGENFSELVKRVGEFMYEIESKYQNNNILIVGHDGMGRALKFLAEVYSFDNLKKMGPIKRINNAEIFELSFVPLPHNENYELDLHKPFIDSVELEKDGKKFKRVKEVLDVWFDSGAMPFAQDHYLFENDKNVFQPEKGLFKKQRGYPADFICEAIDQTRGWFYTLHAIGALMGTGKAYKNVICLGHILDSEGKKMSKSLGNIVEPWEMFDKYGADTLRLWMYSVNQPGESKNFDEKTVLDLHRKFFGLLYNVLAFYELYRERDAEIDAEKEARSTTVVLDQWILARLDQLVELSTNNLENYKLLEPVRATRDFIDDFSTWYLRRSRDRLKDGSLSAKMTMYVVLKTLSKLIAPFAPFSAEDMWQKLKLETDEESVHLTNWPEAGKVNKKIIEEMQKVRDLCTEGNSLRKKLNIPLRQPLATFFIKENLSTDLIEIIKDELNVKNVSVGNEVSFDTEITPELKREGDYRELLRSVQDMRKKSGLEPSDVIDVVISPSVEPLINDFVGDLKKTAGISEIVYSLNDGEEIETGDYTFNITVTKK